MKRLWLDDLKYIKKHRPCWLNPFICLVILPKCWTFKKYDGRAFFNCIIFTYGVMEADADVRKYLLAHEYGHIFNNHILAHVPFLLYPLFAILTIFFNTYWLYIILAILLLAIVKVVIKLSSTSTSNRLEFEADDVVVSLFGKDIALKGIKWMGEKTKTMEKPLRIEKIQRLTD